MYFTDGHLLQYEQMMKAVPCGKPLPALSSTNLPLQLDYKGKKQIIIEEVEKDECGK